MKRRFQSGFTLRDLLVILATIGTLLCLLFPALNRSTSCSRRGACCNNQRNIALAFEIFEQVNGHYPQFRVLAKPHSVCEEVESYNNVYSLDASGRARTHIGWIPQLFIYVEQPQLYEEINSHGYTSNCDVELDLFHCPSSGRIKPNANSYVANCGLADCYPFVDQTVAYGLLTDGIGYGSRVGKKLSAADVADGLSHTLLLSENLQAGTIWSSQEFLVGFCVNYNTFDGSLDYRPHFNDGVRLEDNPGVPFAPNRFGGEAEGYAKMNAGAEILLEYWNTARMSSVHPGIVVAAYADGSVRYVSEKIDIEVLTREMSPNDKETDFWKHGLFKRSRSWFSNVWRRNLTGFL